MLKMGLGAVCAATLIAGVMSFAVAANAASVRSQCSEDWKAAKAAGTTNGQGWSDFYKTCKAQKEAATTAPAAAPSATPVAAPAPTPTAVAAPAPTPAKPAPKKSPVAATGAGEFAAEAEAKAHCPSDTVVWVNTKSHKYHYAGHRAYGTTKQGAYMCEADAKAAGDAASKEEHPKP